VVRKDRGLPSLVVHQTTEFFEEGGSIVSDVEAMKAMLFGKSTEELLDLKGQVESRLKGKEKEKPYLPAAKHGPPETAEEVAEKTMRSMVRVKELQIRQRFVRSYERSPLPLPDATPTSARPSKRKFRVRGEKPQMRGWDEPPSEHAAECPTCGVRVLGSVSELCDACELEDLAREEGLDAPEYHVRLFNYREKEGQSKKAAEWGLMDGTYNRLRDWERREIESAMRRRVDELLREQWKTERQMIVEGTIPHPPDLGPRVDMVLTDSHRTQGDREVPGCGQTVAVPYRQIKSDVEILVRLEEIKNSLLRIESKPMTERSEKIKSLLAREACRLIGMQGVKVEQRDPVVWVVKGGPFAS
jgi:hypothetical protein